MGLYQCILCEMIVGYESTPVSVARRFAVYSLGIAGGVGLALVVILGLFDEAIEMRLYRNCLRAYPEQSLACLTEERAVRFGFYVP